MKASRVIVLAIILLSANISMAQRDSYRLLNDSWQSMEIEFNIADLQTASVNIGGTDFNSVSIEGFIHSSEEGEPCLPVFSRLIEVPQCNGFDVRMSEMEYDTIVLSGSQLMPAQPSRSKSDTTKQSLVINKKLYGTDAFYSLEPAMVEAVGIARDRHIARLQFSPVKYNPVSKKLIVCRHAVVTIYYRNADEEASMNLFNRYYSPHFASGALAINNLYPKSVANAAPIRYLIVAHSSFNGQLNNFIEWKRRKGFITDIVYTGSTNIGTTTTSIASYIQDQYTNATPSNPAPTYLLIVGDHEQVPAFEGTTSSSHITDLYYTTWTTGDNIPDCYCGRFSAQNLSELTPQIQKTLMYEQYTFADPSFLDRAVLVAGVDGGSNGDFGYTHADPAMDYAATHYINSTNGFTQVMYFKNNTSIVPAAQGITIGSSASSNSATVRNYYNQGAGWINYSAHGSATSWGTPNFTTSHVASMTNSQKFGLMIGNCCQSNDFEYTNCFGESLLRKGDYCGAVGYIGGSNSTYWNEDFYWAIGLRSSIGPNMSMSYDAANLGAYDRLCHTHGEAYNQWAMTQASVMMVGNMAVESSTSSRKLYYWEIYHLMGDPSVMPYLTQAPTMGLYAPTVYAIGNNSMTVTAAPYAYIALTEENSHTLVAAAFADANGSASLSIPTSLTPGNYELVASAQQYQTTFTQVTMVIPSEVFPIVLDVTPSTNLEAGSENEAEIIISNFGDSTAYDVTVTLAVQSDTLDSSVTPPLIFTPSTFTFDSIMAGDTIVVNCQITVDSTLADGTYVNVLSSAICSGLSQPIVGVKMFSVTAPVISVDISQNSLCITPNGDNDFVVVVSNHGHAPLRANRMTLASTTRLLSVDFSNAETTVPFTVEPDASATFSFALHADSQLPNGISIPMTISHSPCRNLTETQFEIYIGNSYIENFEGNTYHINSWTQGIYPWAITTDGVYDGSYALRSNESLTHNQTAEFSTTVSLSTTDSVSFYYKVSSEANYDKFHFYIDNSEMLVESGDVDWTHAVFPIPVGTHTLKFTYSKDGSVNRDNDCAWIDNIILPHQTRDVVFEHADFCVGGSDTIGGTAINTTEPIDSSIVLLGAHAYSTIQIIDYSVHPTYSVEQQLVACDSLTWVDMVYTSDADASHIFQSVAGCDSIVFCNIIVNHSVADTINDTTYADSYQWNSETYTETGSYIQWFNTYQGCDSIITLLLTIIDTNRLSVFGTQNQTTTNAVTVYPNPTRGTLFFDRPVRETAVYDAAGQRRLYSHGFSRSIDISALPDGVYIIFLKNDTGTDVHKVILKR